MKYFLVSIFLVSTFLLSCSKKVVNVDPKYTLEELNLLARDASPSTEKGDDVLKLSDYSPGVNRVESKMFSYKRLNFFAVSFETSDQARAEAKRLNQYYARNWLFDRVEGEPLLEDYVILTFKAINPNRQIQRVPKNIPTHAPAEAHGAAAPSAH